MNDYNSHITKEALEQFHKNQLPPEETALLLQHIANCTYCADQFAESFETHLISAPVNLKEEILIKAEKQTKLQKPLKKLSIQKQFFLYSTKVCAAMCGALVLLFTISFQGNSEMEAVSKLNPPSTKEQTLNTKEFVSSVNSSMNQFASMINGHMSSIVSNKNAEESKHQTNTDNK